MAAAAVSAVVAPDANSEEIGRFALPGLPAEVLERFNSFRRSGQFCDVTLLLDDMRRLHVHRALLAAQSPFFESVLSGHEALATPNGEIDIDGMADDAGVATDGCRRQPLAVRLPAVTRVESVERVVDFLYTGRISVARRDLADLLRVSSALLLFRLSALLVRLTEHHLDADNVLDVRQAAVELQLTAARQAADRYLATNGDRIRAALLELDADQLRSALLAGRVHPAVEDRIAASGDNGGSLPTECGEPLVALLIDWATHTSPLRAEKLAGDAATGAPTDAPTTDVAADAAGGRYEKLRALLQLVDWSRMTADQAVALVVARPGSDARLVATVLDAYREFGSRPSQSHRLKDDHAEAILKDADKNSNGTDEGVADTRAAAVDAALFGERALDADACGDTDSSTEAGADDRPHATHVRERLNCCAAVKARATSLAYKCSLCSYQCTQAPQLFDHLELVHKPASGREPGRCDVCPFVTNSFPALLKHRRAHIRLDRPFRCDLCTYRCKQELLLANHRRQHLLPDNLVDILGTEVATDGASGSCESLPGGREILEGQPSRLGDERGRPDDSSGRLGRSATSGGAHQQPLLDLSILRAYSGPIDRRSSRAVDRLSHKSRRSERRQPTKTSNRQRSVGSQHARRYYSSRTDADDKRAKLTSSAKCRPEPSVHSKPRWQGTGKMSTSDARFPQERAIGRLDGSARQSLSPVQSPPSPPLPSAASTPTNAVKSAHGDDVRYLRCERCPSYRTRHAHHLVMHRRLHSSSIRRRLRTSQLTGGRLCSQLADHERSRSHSSCRPPEDHHPQPSSLQSSVAVSVKCRPSHLRRRVGTSERAQQEQLRELKQQQPKQQRQLNLKQKQQQQHQLQQQQQQQQQLEKKLRQQPRQQQQQLQPQKQQQRERVVAGKRQVRAPAGNLPQRHHTLHRRRQARVCRVAVDFARRRRGSATAALTPRENVAGVAERSAVTVRSPSASRTFVGQNAGVAGASRCVRKRRAGFRPAATAGDRSTPQAAPSA